MNTKWWKIIGATSGVVGCALIMWFLGSSNEHTVNNSAFWLALGLFIITTPVKLLRSEILDKWAKLWFVLWGPSLFVVTVVLQRILLQMAIPTRAMSWAQICIQALALCFIFYQAQKYSKQA
jgi:hypothetical protein